MTRAERLEQLEAWYATDGPWASVPTEERLLVEFAAARRRARRQARMLALRLPGVWPWVAFVMAVARAVPRSSACVDPDHVFFVPGGEREGWDVDDDAMRRAVGRYEQLDERLARGEITADGYATACGSVWRDTGVEDEMARPHRVRWSQDAIDQDRETLRWLHRDAFEIAAEGRRLAQFDDPAERWLGANDPERKPRHFDRELAVTGMLQGSGEAADRAWLYAKLSQIRTECSRVSELPGSKALEGKERANAIRLGVSLQHRYVLRRLIEVACERDDREFADTWRSCEEWRRAHGLTYADAVQTLGRKLGVDPARFQVPAKARNVWLDVDRGSVAARRAAAEV